MADDQQVPRDDQTGPSGQPAASDAETAAQPTADQTTALAGAAAAWSGRAEVPSPHADESGVRGATPPDEWVEDDAAQDQPWWLPIAIATVALLFLGVLAYGLWLIFARQSDVPAVTPPSTVVSTTAAATSAASSDPARSASSQPTAPADVVIPRVVGQPEADARALLDSVGLSYHVTYRPTADFVIGTAITTNPPEGTAVPHGTKVTLVIAAAPPTSAMSSPTTAAPTTSAPSPSGSSAQARPAG